ncbi:MAG: hypothetical protein KDA93_22350 [Planctomycetaceae bacterium]|nr:hypothetical protein [Planctomycetaceae bacterium]
MNVDQTTVRVVEHERDFYERQSGIASERVQISSTVNNSQAELIHRVPRSRVLGEPTASVWFRSNRSGAALSMRIVLPHQLDPRTGKPVSMEVRGTPCTEPHRWQQLTVTATDALVEKQMILLRGRLANVLEGRTLDTRDGHVDQVSIHVPVSEGVTELHIDELQMGPLVRLDDEADTIRQINLDQSEVLECPIQITPNELLIEGQPRFPRIAVYHGEDLDELAATGINVVWINRYDDQILLNELRKRGMWAMAAPPQLPTSPDGVPIPSARSGLMPIPASTASVLFWTVGTRIPPDQLRTVENWINQVRDADRAFTRPRPVIADVISNERAFSRQISLIGSSRHMLHTTFVPSQYRDYLAHKKNLALPDRLSWTWLQTEAAAPNLATRQTSRDEPIVVEAEQIWLQVLTALSVGHRAIGYWKSGPLDAESPADQERRLAISLINAQIELLEPLLATGQVVDTVPVEIDAGKKSESRSRSFGDRFLKSGSNTADAESRPDVRAAVIQSKYGRLVMPVWYDNQAQFQPGQMAGNDIRFVVPGGGQHAFAWSVTTTSVHPLELEYPAGGMEIRLPMIDQHAFIVITSDPKFGAMLTQRMQAQRDRSAQMGVELAQLKLKRVKETHQQLEQLARTKVPQADARLTQAEQSVQHAAAQLLSEQPQYDEARQSCRLAMQLLRIVQRDHWENAVADMSSPTTSPHTICFSTLPDHWRMVNAIGRGTGWSGENLLRSGDFEDLDSVIADNWLSVYDTSQNRRVELHSDASSGQYGLRIFSRSDRTEMSPDVPLTPNVSVISPPIPVQGGQIVLISGKYRIEEQVNGHPDGLMLYDNVKGTVGALRFWRGTPKGQWESFRLIREVAHSRDVQFTIELNGDGDVRFDDIRVVALNPPRLASGTQPAEPSKNPRRNLLDFTPSLPKVPFWNGRKSKESDIVPE